MDYRKNYDTRGTSVHKNEAEDFKRGVFSHFWIIKDMLVLYLERYNDTGISQHAKLGREREIKYISAHKHESLS